MLGYLGQLGDLGEPGKPLKHVLPHSAIACWRHDSETMAHSDSEEKAAILMDMFSPFI